MNIRGRVLALLLACAIGGVSRGEEIPVSGTLLKIIATVEVPAQQEGVLRELLVREGSIVDRGERIAGIEDGERRIELEKANVEVAIAKREASSDVNVRFARKSLEVAQAELRRAEEAISIVERSVSASEIDRLKLIVEKNTLEIEQAQEDTAISDLTAQLKQTEQKMVAAKLAKHQIISPIEGMVVNVFRQQGEWVEPSDSVVKVVRIDRLRAEGFVRNEDALSVLENRTVRITVDIPNRESIVTEGKVVFVDPEVDPVNGQVRVWAEIENVGLKLRPGLRAQMVILLP